MSCDHGIRLDRFCGDCESDFTFVIDEHQAVRRSSRLIAVACFGAMALVVFIAYLKAVAS